MFDVWSSVIETVQQGRHCNHIHIPPKYGHVGGIVPLSLMCGPLSKKAESSANQPLGDLLGVEREALEGSGGPLEGSGTALERLLEAFKRHLAQKAVSSTIF